jgi:hypothetical protein
MKKGKLILTLLVVFIAMFVFVGCTENSALMNSLIRTSDNFKVVSNSYVSNENESVNDVQLLTLSDTEYYVIELSDDGPNDLVTFNELRLDLLAIHQEILIEIETIEALVESIRTNAQTIRDSEYILLEGDKIIVLDNIETIKGYRDGLLETKGLAYQRIMDLKGSYTRENLPEILVVFEEVYEVLEYRLNTLRLGVIEFENINQILLDYMES